LNIKNKHRLRFWT